MMAFQPFERAMSYLDAWHLQVDGQRFTVYQFPVQAPLFYFFLIEV